MYLYKRIICVLVLGCNNLFFQTLSMSNDATIISNTTFEQPDDPKPTVILNTWKNNSSHAIDFLTGKFGEKGTNIFHSLNPGQKITIDHTISLEDPRKEWSWNINERTGHIDISRHEKYVIPYLKLWIQYLPLRQKIKVDFLQTFAQSNRHPIDCSELTLDNPKSCIYINGTIEGDTFENSKIKLELSAD